MTAPSTFTATAYLVLKTETGWGRLPNGEYGYGAAKGLKISSVRQHKPSLSSGEMAIKVLLHVPRSSVEEFGAGG